MTNRAVTLLLVIKIVSQYYKETKIVQIMVKISNYLRYFALFNVK